MKRMAIYKKINQTKQKTLRWSALRVCSPLNWIQLVKSRLGHVNLTMHWDLCKRMTNWQMQGKAKTNVKTTKCKTGSNWPAKSISQMQSQCQKNKEKKEKWIVAWQQTMQPCDIWWHIVTHIRRDIFWAAPKTMLKFKLRNLIVTTHTPTPHCAHSATH